MYLDSLSLKIDPAKCIGCGCCVRECVNNVLCLDDRSGQPAVIPGGEARCIHCGHCLMACPAGAFSMDGRDPGTCEKPGKGPDFRTLLELVKNRRSIRHYKQQNVDPAVLQDLLEALRYSPTGVNYGKLHFCVIDDVARMNVIREDFYRKCAASDNPDLQAWAEAWKKQGRDIMFRTAPHMILAAYEENSFCGRDDAVIALSYFEMLANSCGVGTVWFGRLMSTFARMMPEYVQDFRLPAGYKPGYAMLFGYPGTKFYRNVARSLPGITRL